MALKPNISVIITCKNGYKWLNKCLQSLINQTNKNFEIIFVDDGSTDGSINFVRKYYPNIKVIENLSNVGFARANNNGASLSQGDYLFFLNLDTYLDINTVEKVITKIKENKNLSIMQLDIRRYDKSNMNDSPCTFRIDPFGYPIGYEKHDKIFYADAAALVIKRDLFFELRGFDESYFIYLEDMDLSWRARLLGYEVYFLPNIYVYHYGGGTSVSTLLKKGKYTTSERRRYDAQKNNLRSLIKNYSLHNLIWALPISILLASLEGFLYLIKGNYKGFLALHKAILWNFLHITDSINERKIIQKQRIISDKVILDMSIKRISKVNSLLIHGIPSMKS